MIDRYEFCMRFFFIGFCGFYKNDKYVICVVKIDFLRKLGRIDVLFFSGNLVDF